MSISLTDSAATRVRTFLEKRGRGVGLRLGVRRSGCNGWAYTIDYADDVAPVLNNLSKHSELAYLHRQASLEDVFLKLTGRDLRD